MKKQITKFVILMFILAAVPINIIHAQNLSDRLSGKILLQVEGVGQIWYIDPETKERAFLGRPADAFRIMRELGLGISEQSYNSFNEYAPSRLSGRILLRVEANGEAYYVFPDDLKMYYLGRPADAFNVMWEKGLGITDEDLNKVPIFQKYKEKIVEKYQKNKISSTDTYYTLRGATTTPEEIVSWQEFINNRVGWRFKYPTENLTRPIDEIVKFPSVEEGESKTEDLLEFAIGDTVFSIKTYVDAVASTSTLEAWIEKPNKLKVFNVDEVASTSTLEDLVEKSDKPRVSNNLNDYEKFTIAGNDAYNLRGEAFAYTLADNSVYEIVAYQNEVPARISSEPLFKKWISTINFFEKVECWKSTSELQN